MTRRPLAAVAALVTLAVLAAGVVVSRGWRRWVRASAAAAVGKRFPAARLGEQVSFRFPSELTFGPLDVPVREGGQAVLHADRIHVLLRASALLRGRVEPVAMVLRGARVEAGRDGRDLVDLVEQVHAASGASLKDFSLDVGVEGLELAFEHGQRVSVGPIALRGAVVRLGGVRRAALEARLPGSGKVLFDYPAVEPGAVFSAAIEQAPLGLLATVPLPAKVEGGLLDGRVTLFPARAAFALDASGLVASRAGFAHGPVGPMRLRVDGGVSWEAEARRASLEGVTLRLGDADDAPVRLEGAVTLGAAPRFDAKASVDGVSYARLVAGLPPQLAPGEGAEGVDGPFTASVAASGALLDRSTWDITPSIDLAPMRKAARASRYRLREPFRHQVLTAQGRGRGFVVGPSNPNFTPYAQIPRALVRSVLVSEDASFFVHSGFDFESLETNLLAERAEGEPIRGGSSISQQLAKNLFLTRERTYARKLREAFLTIALEAATPKERLLEIYFNIIEWGPDLYGVGEAARHYFGKSPSALTTREAAFLASIIPNPVKFHAYCARGALTDGWDHRLRLTLDKLHALGDLDDGAYLAALSETLVFRHGGR